jgi:hypothetical protein
MRIFEFRKNVGIVKKYRYDRKQQVLPGTSTRTVLGEMPMQTRDAAKICNDNDNNKHKLEKLITINLLDQKIISLVVCDGLVMLCVLVLVLF